MVLFASAFFLPWWLAVPLGVALTFRAAHAYELLALGIVLDALYGLPLRELGGFRFPFTLLCTALFLATECLKPKMRIWVRHGVGM